MPNKPASLIPSFSVSKRIALARSAVEELATSGEQAYCLAVAANNAIFDQDKESTAIKLLEVLEELLGSTVHTSAILEYLPEETDHGKRSYVFCDFLP